MTSRSVTLGALDQDHVELADQRMVVGLGHELLDQQDRAPRPGSSSRTWRRRGAACRLRGRCRLRWSGRSIVIEVGRNMPCRTLRASKVSDAVGTVAITWCCAVDEAQPVEHQAHRLADAAPFERDAVDLGLDVVARHVGRLGDAVLQEVEVDGTCHQAKGGHHDERGDGEDDAGHHPHAHPIRSSDQRLDTSRFLTMATRLGERAAGFRQLNRPAHRMSWLSTARLPRPHDTERRDVAWTRWNEIAARPDDPAAGGAARCPVRQQPVSDRNSRYKTRLL